MRRRPLIAASAALLLALTACGGQEEAPAPEETATQQAPEGTESQGQETPDTETDGPISITDMVGRTVELDAPASTVFGAGPPATALLYTFDPAVMAGWNTPASDQMLQYVPDEIADLPVVGRVTGGKGDFNPEGLLEQGVDLIIDAGDLDESYVETADDLQEQTGIPVVMLSTDPEELDEAYEILGTLTGNAERAQEIGAHTTEIVETVSATAETIPEEERATIYYGAGADALNTAGAGSIHTRVIEAVGAVNVVDIDSERSGRVDVDSEQILAWDPDWVIVSPDTQEDQIAVDPTSHPNLGTLSAFDEDAYLLTPKQPFGWFDGPPSVNQVLGMIWVAESVYPDEYDFDLTQEVIDFYDVYYHYEMDETEADELLATANTPGFE